MVDASGPSTPAIFTNANKLMMRAVSEYGFETVELNGMTSRFGAQDGKKFLYRPGSSDDDNLHMRSSYQDRPTNSYFM
jgi:hypothetical protein